ncbi:YkvA family protein [Sulfurovum lithotrophicum]|uniref:YkvA family protein n=1 Tax=Sulfurovum lithotrophicum TaxID=206403 RepID=UPI000697532B|nr:hypothetical protein [Sulfurovum lithotrophicum]
MKNQSDHNSKITIIIRFWNDIRALAGLIRAYWKNEYRDISWMTIVIISVTFSYMLFSPIGFIPVLGQIDDIIVLAICLKLIYADLEKYKHFKEEQKSQNNNTGN